MQKENGGMARVDAVPVLHDGLFPMRIGSP